MTGAIVIGESGGHAVSACSPRRPEEENNIEGYEVSGSGYDTVLL